MPHTPVHPMHAERPGRISSPLEDLVRLPCPSGRKAIPPGDRSRPHAGDSRDSLDRALSQATPEIGFARARGRRGTTHSGVTFGERRGDAETSRACNPGSSSARALLVFGGFAELLAGTREDRADRVFRHAELLGDVAIVHELQDGRGERLPPRVSVKSSSILSTSSAETIASTSSDAPSSTNGPVGVRVTELLLRDDA